MQRDHRTFQTHRVTNHLFHLPPDLPVPIDDGAASHLRGATLPQIVLPATHGAPVPLHTLHRAVIFFYPRTGVPGFPTGRDWDEIPGARGCTPQSCAFRDMNSEFVALGVSLFACSTQTTTFQQEFSQRNHIPFPILSDADLVLTRQLRLPCFEFAIHDFGGGGPTTLIRRMAWYVESGAIRHVWYPVFPPDKNAEEVFSWLRQSRG